MEPVKRSLCDASDSCVKRPRIEARTILDFSDCVLSIILSYLKPYDLYCLSKTCQRFRYLMTERKLWRRLDVLAHPMCARKFRFFFDKVHRATETVLVSGISKKEKTLTFAQFIQLYEVCDHLTVLAIENQYINSDEIGLKDFPESLRELSLRGTHIYGRQPFLQDAHLRLHKLHTLILDDCKWFHEHSLMALSKLVSLENLSLYKCGNLNDSVAYMSITAKFGFRKLLRIDARCTSIGDQFLKCFHCIKTLREIYLEAPQRREAKKKPLFDELRKLCDSQLQETTSAVVFNRSNIFKLRRDRVVSKQLKKRPAVSCGLPTHHHQQQQQQRAHFSCVDSCAHCSMDTCSLRPVCTRTPPPQAPAEQPPFYAAADSGGAPFEVFFCDDVSDSEDEMLDFEIFHSDVTDSGVQWFCTTDPHAQDHLGHESVLFRKPYKECTCRRRRPAAAVHVDTERPGPSGLGHPGPSKCQVSMTLPKKLVIHELSTSNDSSSGGEESPPPSLRPPQPAQQQQPPPPRRFHNDVTVNVSGQGAVCLKIAYESSGDETDGDQADVAAPRPSAAAAKGAGGGESGGARALPDLDHIGQAIRGRDLRVIIERLDPGVHIVYDQGGRVQFDNYMKDYTTKLKVFVARGYKLITNHALRSLQDLRLELLDVTGTSVSGRGVKEFLLVNPDCRVIHESTCTCN